MVVKALREAKSRPVHINLRSSARASLTFFCSYTNLKLLRRSQSTVMPICCRPSTTRTVSQEVDLFLIMASLFVVRGRDQGKHFKLTGSVQRIGRDSSNDIQLLDTEVSRSHAEIRIASDMSCELIDLASSNGTFVNNVATSRHRLSSGDRVEIGHTLMIFTGTGNPTAIDAAHGVDIVRQSQSVEASRIVSLFSKAASPLSQQTEADRSLEVMYLTAIAVGRTDDLNELLERVLKLVFDWVVADRGCVMLRDSDTNQLRPAARCDRNDLTEKQLQAMGRMSISHTILDYVINHREGVRTSDASDDVRFESAASIVQGGVREALCVPLQGRYDTVGALYVDTYTSPGEMIASGRTQRFTDDHLRLITAIGHQAALAIEDTFYYSALVQNERLAAMGQTIATLSHHVKNILQGIRGGSYLIEAGLERQDTDAIRRGWSIVDRNQDRISNLVLDMLTFSKEREPELVEADLNETIRDVVELMETRASEMGVVLGSFLDASIPLAKFDPDAIHRAAMNLVTNAIDSAADNNNEVASQDDEATEFETDDGLLDASSLDDHSVTESAVEKVVGKVFVATRFDPTQGWMVDVIDNGKGIAPEDRQKVFSLFESRKGARGTGLGLPVSAKIMHEHGGRIEIHDPDTGCGCCFRLVLPPTQSLTEMASRETMF
jgi:two-component system, NtrC family, sensor kinase